MVFLKAPRRQMRRTCVLAGFAALLALAGLPAQALEAPKGPVILIMDGAIAISNEAGGRALFDREMLERMGTTTVVTTTPWTEGVPKFEGVFAPRAGSGWSKGGDPENGRDQRLCG